MHWWREHRLQVSVHGKKIKIRAISYSLCFHISFRSPKSTFQIRDIYCSVSTGSYGRITIFGLCFYTWETVTRPSTNTSSSSESVPKSTYYTLKHSNDIFSLSFSDTTFASSPKTIDSGKSSSWNTDQNWHQSCCP